MLGTLRLQAQNLIKTSRGVATSLIEATATIAIGATLASAALSVVSDKVQEAKIARVTEEVKGIGSAFTSFYTDMLNYPIYFDGKQTGPADPSADVIRSHQGDKAEDSDSTLFIIDTVNFESTRADLSLSRNWNDEKTFIDAHTDRALVDSFENQLNLNTPGSTGAAYSLRGELEDPIRGFNGPYFQSIPPTDAWGNKYYVNSRFLNPANTLLKTANDQTVKFSVFALSAGPNETIQTPYGISDEETGGEKRGNVKAQGDDIVARIR